MRNWTKTLTDAHILAVVGHTPFELACVEYGYTVIGKGTTSGLWKEVSREAQVYQILRKAQSANIDKSRNKPVHTHTHTIH
ncbi:unnamed protein product [Penicillium roqueforti FM164]|jgi:hypothetical protein|uniref:Genomic scaffold, ProqFM164S03 n=1 Tax=Penicillium roqueforti (strain FM164) TaxID=1365484 RepID=W6QGL0_PENRF|nr:unnamed protein product [Penicillium roqueforti FM164]